MRNIKNYIEQEINGFKVLDSKRENNKTYLKIICPKCKQEKWMEQYTLKSASSCGCKKKGRKTIDLTGKKFGELTVLKRVESEDNVVRWECLCSCGKKIIVRSQSLRNGQTISCGCKKRRTTDYTGHKFGRLTLLEKTDKTEKNGYIYKCRCDCGNIVYKPISLMKSGGIKSCGCLQKEANREKIGEIRKINQVEGTSVGRIANKKIAKNNTSGHTGVTKAGDYWQAKITFKGKVYYLGSSRDKEKAIGMREAAEKIFYGDFLEWYAKKYPEQWKKINNKASK